MMSPNRTVLSNRFFSGIISILHGAKHCLPEDLKESLFAEAHFSQKFRSCRSSGVQELGDSLNGFWERVLVAQALVSEFFEKMSVLFAATSELLQLL